MEAIYLQGIRFIYSEERLKAKIDLSNPVQFIKEMAVWARKGLKEDYLLEMSRL